MVSQVVKRKKILNTFLLNMKNCYSYTVIIEVITGIYCLQCMPYCGVSHAARKFSASYNHDSSEDCVRSTILLLCAASIDLQGNKLNSSEVDSPFLSCCVYDPPKCVVPEGLA